MKGNFVAKHNYNRHKVHTDRMKLLKTYGTQEIYECPSCDGEGIDVDWDGYVGKCSMCKGTGEIIVED